MKKRFAAYLLVLGIAFAVFILRLERQVPFEYVSSFLWIESIVKDTRPPFGTFWWGLTKNPDAYLPYDTLAEQYHYATGERLEDFYPFDFDQYTYVIVQGHNLLELSYNYLNIWGRFTGKYPWYHGRAVLQQASDPRTINIYRIKKMLITSDEHSRGGTIDPRIVFK